MGAVVGGVVIGGGWGRRRSEVVNERIVGGSDGTREGVENGGGGDGEKRGGNGNGEIGSGDAGGNGSRRGMDEEARRIVREGGVQRD